MLRIPPGPEGKVPYMAAKTRPVIVETLNQQGATALARRLQQFWHAKGYLSARFWPEPIGENIDKVGSCELYRVACNLINGFPPRGEHDLPAPPEIPPRELSQLHP